MHVLPVDGEFAVAAVAWHQLLTAAAAQTTILQFEKTNKNMNTQHILQIAALRSKTWHMIMHMGIF